MNLPTKRLRSERMPLILLVIYIAIILLITLSSPGPAYLSDEVGYASKAAHIAGFNNLLSSSWHAGYSISLAPLFMLFGLKPVVWIAVALFNLILLAASLYFWISTLQKLGCTKRKAILLSLSSLVCFSVWGFTGWIFVNPWLQLIVAMMSRWLQIRNRFMQLLAIAVTGGWAYWIHPTGLLIAACAWLTVTTDLLYKRRSSAIKPLGGIAAAMLLTLGLMLIYKPIHNAINISMGGDGGHYAGQISSYLTALQNDAKQTLTEIGTGLFNGIANLSIATYGYGMLFAARIKRPNPEIADRWDRNRFLTSLFIATTCLSLLLFSSFLSINQPGDYQHMMHQRYTAPIVQALWILGISHWIDLEDRSNLPSRLCLSLSPILAALIAGCVLWDYNKQFSIIDNMSSGSSVISNALHSEQEALAGLVIGSLLIIAIQALTWRPKLLAAGVLASIIGWIASDKKADILSAGSAKPGLIDQINALSERKAVCLVALRTNLSASETDNLYELYLSSPKIQRVRNRYEDRTTYNKFYNPDSSSCDYIVAPLDLHLSTDRSDLKAVNSKLESCQLISVDDRNGWGLNQCLKQIQSDKQEGFFTTSNGKATGPLPAGPRPIRVYTEEALRHEEDKLNYGILIIRNGRLLVEPCRTQRNPRLRQHCKQRQEVVIEATPNIPLIWGLYEEAFNAGHYQLLPKGLEVYQGTVTVELVDAKPQRFSSQTFQSNSKIIPIPFELISNQQRFEIRIQASAGARFKPPTHLIMAKVMP